MGTVPLVERGTVFLIVGNVELGLVAHVIVNADPIYPAIYVINDGLIVVVAARSGLWIGIRFGPEGR